MPLHRAIPCRATPYRPVLSASLPLRSLPAPRTTPKHCRRRVVTSERDGGGPSPNSARQLDPRPERTARGEIPSTPCRLDAVGSRQQAVGSRSFSLSANVPPPTSLEPWRRFITAARCVSNSHSGSRRDYIYIWRDLNRQGYYNLFSID